MPVIETIAADYQGQVTFLAVAGNGSSLDATTARANELIPSGNVKWTIDDSVWDTYGVGYQPVTFAISHDNVVVAEWFGAASESDIRGVLDDLAGTST